MRLKDYDYSQAGGYFITTVTQDRKHLFGEIVHGVMGLNEYGCVVIDEWLRTTGISESIELDEFIIMPNHFHGIVILHDKTASEEDGVGVTRRVDGNEEDRRVTLRVTPTKKTPLTLGTIVGQFKSRVTKRIRAMDEDSGIQVWQRYYYDHIIRDDDGFNRIREYIGYNPLSWEHDKENPHRKGDDEFDSWLELLKGRP